MTRLSIVVVRYGPDIAGGAETHAREVAHRLAGCGHEVTVLTTCADDYATWVNVRPAGESTDGPVRVLRFPTARPRDPSEIAAAMAPLSRGGATAVEEARFIDEQGPYCPDLIDHLKTSQETYDAVILFTLLYAPTVLGLTAAGGRTILVPTLHDELAVRTSVHGEALRRAGFVMWNTPEERDLAAAMFGDDVRRIPSAIAGVGVDAPKEVDSAAIARRYDLDRPYLLFAGRIDAEKGCKELVRYTLAMARDDDRLLLALVGRLWIALPESPRIRHLGFVPEAHRWALIAGARAVVIPSRMESLSMLTLEAFAVGTAALVRAESPVLAGHARRSAGALTYAGYAEFAEAVGRLLDDPNLATVLGRNGRRYVGANYTWDRVLALYELAIRRVSGSPSGSPAPPVTGRP